MIYQAKTHITRLLVTTLSGVFMAFAVLTPSAQSEDAASPALWMASDEDSIVYIFGTIHVLEPDMPWHSKKVNDAFRSASTLMLEAPALDTPPAEIQATVLKYARNAPGVGLSSLISAETDANLLVTLEKLGMPRETALQTKLSLEGFRPWFVGVQLAMMQMQADGYDPAAGVESVLYAAAKRAEMEMAYLETLDQQFTLLSGLPMKAEIEMLDDTLLLMDQQSSMLKDMIHYWRTGKTVELGKIMQAGMSNPIVYQHLLTDRNRDWAKQIDSLMEGAGTTFIAVGAGHLAGKGSVQDFLKLHGIETIRIQ